jgi:acetylornithine deacetylase/succinyl-diaminopimelate desuccinylase-like protein
MAKSFMRIALKFFFFCLITTSLWAQSPQATVDRVASDPRLKIAEQFIRSDHDRIIREIISLTEIPAPPFMEGERARAFVSMLKEHGLTSVEIDSEGNAMGLRKGTGNGPLIAIAAHLDTVFPEGTKIKVKKEGTRLLAPGVGDDTRGLAVMLGIIRALDNAKIQTASDILFVGDVGEEGPGDLRGMKYLFEKGPYKNKIKMFVSLDGAGDGSELTTGALGSRRYRVTYKGPGGHSYGSFGLVNPAYALAGAMNRLSRIPVSSNPRTTFNVGVIGGGTSVNAIPNEAWMDVDLRSESPENLERLSDSFVVQMRAAADDENAVRSTVQGKVEVESKLIGERPSGSTPISSPIVQIASAVVMKFGMQPTHSIGSTDANIPISLHIPAITIDSGGNGGRAHSLDEWIDVEKNASVKGIHLVMTILVSLAGLQ